MAASPGDKPSDEERESIKEKHSKLTKELLEVRGKVHHLEKEIKAVQKEILEAGCNIYIYFLCVFLVHYCIKFYLKVCNAGNDFKQFLNNIWYLEKQNYLLPTGLLYYEVIFG